MSFLNEMISPHFVKTIPQKTAQAESHAEKQGAPRMSCAEGIMMAVENLYNFFNVGYHSAEWCACGHIGHECIEELCHRNKLVHTDPDELLEYL